MDEYLNQYNFIALIDGAWDGVRGGIGGFLLNHSKQLEFIFSGPTTGDSPVEVERDALYYICSVIKQKADLPHKSKLTWDSSLWFFKSSKISFKWIKREWNISADKLAKEGANRLKLISGWI